MYIQNKFISYTPLVIYISLLFLTPLFLHASLLDEEILEKIQELKKEWKMLFIMIKKSLAR